MGSAVAYIDLGVNEEQLPGIAGLLRFRPETAGPMSELAEVLLRGPSSLSRGERELVGAYVSGLNECKFCSSSHSAYAAAQLDDGMALVAQVRADLETAPIPAKVRALLRIAGAVADGGRTVTSDLVEAAKLEGATDVEVHDVVLIAAMFCMMNRYVDGLGTSAPDDPGAYARMAEFRVAQGYVRPPAG